jgi:hypothetical protein
MDGLAAVLVIGAVGGFLTAFLLALTRVLLGPRPCPECGTPAPVVRVPAGVRQMLRGGWTCSGCGIELDHCGRPVTPCRTPRGIRSAAVEQAAELWNRRPGPSSPAATPSAISPARDSGPEAISDSPPSNTD